MEKDKAEVLRRMRLVRRFIFSFDVDDSTWSHYFGILVNLKEDLRELQ